MTTQVQRLEALGLVERASDVRDARATLVSMTTQGRGVLEEARHARADVVEPLLEGLSPEELDTLDAALDILERSLASRREIP